jgi:hypothetical protein
MENKDFEDPAVFGRVKLAVTNRVLQWLQEHSDQDSVPTLQFFNSIVEILGQKYPEMFAEDHCNVVDGKKVLFYNYNNKDLLSHILSIVQN